MQHHGHHHGREADQQPADAVDAGLEGGGRAVGGVTRVASVPK
jgi:hypothetical protein